MTLDKIGAGMNMLERVGRLVQVKRERVRSAERAVAQAQGRRDSAAEGVRQCELAVREAEDRYVRANKRVFEDSDLRTSYMLLKQAMACNAGLYEEVTCRADALDRARKELESCECAVVSALESLQKCFREQEKTSRQADSLRRAAATARGIQLEMEAQELMEVRIRRHSGGFLHAEQAA